MCMRATTADRAILRGLGACSAAMLAWLAAGCKPNEPPPPPSGPVTAYGITVDRNATPEQVAYVLLRAIRDDVLAVRKNPYTAQTAAYELQRRLAVAEARGQGAEQRYEPVRHWAPTLAHYVDGIELDPDAAMSKMYRESRPGSDAAAVFYDMRNPSDGARATAKIYLLKRNGVWRVQRVGYSAVTAARMLALRKHATRPTTRPAKVSTQP